MRNCFIPNCDFLCKQMTKRMMFMPPKDEKIFAQWKAVLPKKREFKRMDRVCERHFNVEDIQKTWDHIINGELHQLLRDKPKLKENAVPSLNLNNSPEISTLNTSAPIKRRITRKTRQSEVLTNDFVDQKAEIIELEPPVAKKKSEIVLKDEEAAATSPTPSPTPSSAEKSIENGSANVLITVVDDKVAEDEVAKEAEVAEVPEEDPIDDSFFDFIYDDVYEVVLPTTMYGIHRDPDRKFIVFSLFDAEKMTTIKSLYVNDRLQAKMSIDSVIIETGTFPELTVDVLTNMLAQMDAQKLCEAYDDRRNEDDSKEQCLVLTTDGSDLCEGCSHYV